MTTTSKLTTIACVALLISGALFADGPLNGRLSLYGTMQSTDFDDGSSRELNELRAWLELHSEVGEEGGLEYALAVRNSTYPSSDGRDSRTSLYDAWVGTATRTLTLRAGQMWIPELGGIGSVGGAMAEYRVPGKSAAGRFRFGLFGGLEPETYDTGYVDKIKKAGGWVAIDGDRNRKHVLGYVLIRNDDLTERSVVTMTNFIPLGRQVFVYQMGEYDLSGPGGDGSGGLTYFFVNGRYTPSRKFEFLGTFHRGHSIDARTITNDILEGRPVDQRALDGYLYESLGGRFTVEVVRNVRVYAGYARDKSDREGSDSGRITAGLSAMNVGGSGFDITVSDQRIDRDQGDYDAWYVSLGHNLGPRVYLSVDYATSLSIVRIVDSGGATIESRPETDRYGINGVWNMNRAFSLILHVEQIEDETATDDRAMLGLVYRF